MKKRYIYIATLALFLGACSDNELEQTYTSEQNTEIKRNVSAELS